MPRPLSPMRVGLVGCGRSGLGKLKQLLLARAELKIVALADAFADKVQQAVRSLKGRYPAQFDVEASQRFVGLDSCERLVKTDLDLVILAASPAFRPLHLQAAVQHACQAYVLSPVAANPMGTEIVMAALRAARQRGIRVGIESPAEIFASVSHRLENGLLGEIHELVSEGPIGRDAVRRRARHESDLDWQLRNSSYHVKLSGPPAAKQHVQHALLGQHFFANALEGCRVLTQASDSQGHLVSRLRLDFQNGKQLISHCKLSPHNSCSSRTWMIGSSGQYDLTHGRLLNRQGQVVKRSGPRPTPAAVQPNQVGGTDKLWSIDQPNAVACDPLSVARTHQQILQAMSAKAAHCNQTTHV
jgi:hypothetical protein